MELKCLRCRKPVIDQTLCKECLKKIDRVCLKCGKKFKANGKFMRRCYQCNFNEQMLYQKAGRSYLND